MENIMKRPVQSWQTSVGYFQCFKYGPPLKFYQLVVDNECYSNESLNITMWIRKTFMLSKRVIQLPAEPTHKNTHFILYYLSKQYSSVFQIFSFVHGWYHGTRLQGKHKVTPQINEIIPNTDFPEPIAQTTIQQMWHNANFVYRLR